MNKALFTEQWRKMKNGKKLLFFIFVALFFLNSNITAINRGPCVVSACSLESDRFGDSIIDSDVEESTYIHTESNALFAPSSLLLLLFPYPKEIEFRPDTLFFKLGYDNNEDFELERDRDESWARLMYVVTKLIILLSLPLWIFVSFWITKSTRRIIFTLLLFVPISLLSLINLFFIAETGVTTLTWEILLGR